MFGVETCRRCGKKALYSFSQRGLASKDPSLYSFAAALEMRLWSCEITSGVLPGSLTMMHSTCDAPSGPDCNADAMGFKVTQTSPLQEYPHPSRWL